MNYSGDAAEQVVRFSLEGMEVGDPACGSLKGRTENSGKSKAFLYAEIRQGTDRLFSAAKRHQEICAGGEEVRRFVLYDSGSAE